ncbi:MAG: rhomboid family intramembrane serine protease [Pseudomonadota bacterium]
MFVPLHDANSLKRIDQPIVTWLILATCIVVYVVFQVGAVGNEAQRIVYQFGTIPSVVNDRAVLPSGVAVLPEGFSLVTYAFLHGDAMHLIGNMLFLWVFGDNVEDAMGHVRFAFFYAACAVAGGLAYVWSFPGSDAPLIGASGAVSGVVAAYLMLHPKVKLWVLAFAWLPLQLRAQWLLGAWVLLQFYSLFTQTGGAIAWIAHVGGLFAGAVLIVVLRRPGTPLFDRSPS